MSGNGKKLPARLAFKYGAVDEIFGIDELMGKALFVCQQLGEKDAVQFSRHKSALRAKTAEVLIDQDLDFMRDLVEKIKGGKKA